MSTRKLNTSKWQRYKKWTLKYRVTQKYRQNNCQKDSNEIKSHLSKELTLSTSVQEAKKSFKKTNTLNILKLLS